MSWHRHLLLAALPLALCACDSAPTDPTEDVTPEIRAFLRADPSLLVRGARVVFADSALGITVFDVTYGEPQDCPSGCFYLNATGVRVGTRTGWVQRFGPTPTPSVFVVQPQDSSRFTSRFLDTLKMTDIYAFNDVAFALACAPATSANIREKLVRENPNLPVPLYCPR